MSDRAAYIREAREKYDSYDSDDWIRAGFDEHSGGYFVYHRKHPFDPAIGKYTIPRGNYEKNAPEVFAVYGMNVVLNEMSVWKGYKKYFNISKSRRIKNVTLYCGKISVQEIKNGDKSPVIMYCVR